MTEKQKSDAFMKGYANGIVLAALLMAEQGGKTSAEMILRRYRVYEDELKDSGNARDLKFYGLDTLVEAGKR
jgi:hypothetical protein